ncbi:UPF0600 protein C5orf51 [Varanus komodoensis]|uniref:Chromosome 5 open reading frame 51 n=1 Tax=Varanus komodoensis TaxID=61221 RepID=A0A8D2ILK8_VARKO|nr:UPF0600 protein C5orf51 homolog [Varanus komodoensis]KAF7250428.1 UPF0600 protein C5orf51 [Varanus komodoensis]
MAGAGSAGCLQERLAVLKERLRGWSKYRDSDDFLTQASITLESLTELLEEPIENSTLPRFVQLYTQAVLDITYFEENQLVDEEFPEESSLWKVEDIIRALSEPEVLVNESSASQEPFTLLSTELLECLYWRRGALLYMFCHTLKGRKEWLTKKVDLLKKFLHEGIHYLVKMLEFRCPDTPNEEFESRDAATARLVHEGIFSDTHLLAMMYCGEMCYWGLKYCAKEKEQTQSTESELTSNLPSGSHIKVLDFRETGEKMLQKYISVCEGPLRLHDWDTKNAKLILDYFKQLTT